MNSGSGSTTELEVSFQSVAAFTAPRPMGERGGGGNGWRQGKREGKFFGDRTYFQMCLGYF